MIGGIGFDMKLHGLRELTERMRGLSAKIQKKHLNRALMAAAKLIVDDAKRRAPRGLTLAIYRNIVRKTARRKDGATARVIIGVRHGKVRTQGGGKKLSRYDKAGLDPFYWWFHEFGTAKLAARPFLRPAFEANARAALEMIRTTLAKGIEEELRRALSGRRR